MSVNFGSLFLAASALWEAGEAEDGDVGRGLAEMLGALAPYDHCVVFAYRGDARPIDLYSSFTKQDYHVFVTLYQQGPYLLDPFYRAATLPRPGVWRMRELAPDRFFASEYYRTYYVETRLAEEIGFFIPVEGGVTVVLSLMRAQATGPFRAADIDLLRKAEPLVAAMIRSAFRDLARRFAQSKASPQPAETSGIRQPLTEREKAIIELVLQGHSSESIGLTLGIATGTVKVHRRNIYRKLGIASQTQLMSHYLENLKTKG
ncbi:helix-turn-helix transcriptional regulator [Rhizobium sp. TRM95796]|uniref:helix-turn-helix transcriptional regulator n=1 Tax=Rhizobium sp. TRM95796 TaxID=2979862 RepID=UPI0021E73187|nr:LuxR C-terminal-related transcriptional regulator [Rhizobium sp. TRM95796]MCV3768490.1 LuxR C-terminal-related transcriptional regulator [Rhizobium sp. TRM95796]